MAIKRMISRDPSEMRLFQTRMTTFGRIRLGIFNPDKGRSGAPDKLDRFRFTAPDRDLIQAVADEYGGTPREWSPQRDPKRKEWEVITDAQALHVYLVNGQKIDPLYEAWAAGRTCVRRCDGEWNSQTDEACLCNGPDRPSNPQELCKITTRVQVMLQRVQGIGSWLLETHGENAAAEMAMLGPFVASAPVPVPAMLKLRAETRREWNPDKRGGAGFETKNFYVPYFEISAVTSQQVAIGGDALSLALEAAGAPAAIAAPVSAAPRAIEARATAPASAPPARTPDGGMVLTPALRAKALGDVEAAATVEALVALRDRFAGAGVRDKAVMDAWVSKHEAITAAQRREAADADTLSPADRSKLKAELAAGQQRADEVATAILTGDADKLRQHGRRLREAGEHAAAKVAETAADRARVAVVEDEDPATWPAEMDEVHAPIDAEVVDDGRPALPEVPEGVYDYAVEMAALMAVAGRRTPPLTLDQVGNRLKEAFSLPTAGDASGAQVRRLRLHMEQGH